MGASLAIPPVLTTHPMLHRMTLVIAIAAQARAWAAPAREGFEVMVRR